MRSNECPSSSKDSYDCGVVMEAIRQWMTSNRLFIANPVKTVPVRDSPASVSTKQKFGVQWCYIVQPLSTVRDLGVILE